MIFLQKNIAINKSVCIRIIRIIPYNVIFIIHRECTKKVHIRKYISVLVQKSQTLKKCAKVFRYKFTTIPSFLVQQKWH